MDEQNLKCVDQTEARDKIPGRKRRRKPQGQFLDVEKCKDGWSNSQRRIQGDGGGIMDVDDPQTEASSLKQTEKLKRFFL